MQLYILFGKCNTQKEVGSSQTMSYILKMTLKLYFGTN